MIVETWFGDCDVSLERTNYINNGNLAIQMWCEEDGFKEPFATLTVNLGGEKLPSNQAYVDVNNCPWAEQFIEDNELGRPMFLFKKSGFCQYPLYEFIEWEGELA